MDTKKHKDSFDNVYRQHEYDTRNIKFPLEEIEKFEWHRGPYGNDYYSYFYRRFSCHILSRLNLKSGQKILIVGCGAGLDEKNIKMLCPDVELWSIDISEEMLRIAVANQTPSHLFLSIAEAMPFKDSSFDRILSREVIEHVMEPQKMLLEISRLLKPNGIAVVTTENEESFSPKNYYAMHLKKNLAQALGISLAEPRFKDESPSLAEMKQFVQTSGLTLVEYFFDGALYKFLLPLIKRLRKLLKFKIARFSHWFSCLENHPRLAFWFCDQAKYVLKKPSHSDPHPSQVENLSSFQKLKLNGRENIETSKQPRLPGEQLKYKVFKTLNFLLRSIFNTTYFFLALTCTVFVKKNTTQYSQLIDSNHYLQRYLKID
jgi:ubiquinone/menaquinone biosynthesis C-methylase UbiE